MHKLDKIETVAGQFGPFARLTIDGNEYSAMGKFYNQVRGMKPGDDFPPFTFENKGKYVRITSIGPNAAPAPSGGPTGNPSGPAPRAERKSSYVPKDSTEFNYMMATRYALDYLIAMPDSSVASAAEMVVNLYKEIAKRWEAKELASVISIAAGRGSVSDIARDVEGKLAKLKIDPQGLAWQRFIERNYKKTKGGEIGGGDLKAISSLLDRAISGQVKATTTPDGIIAFVTDET